MAIWYVDSAAGGTAAGTSWTNAAPSLYAASLLSLNAGDIILVDDGHSYAPTTTQTATFPARIVIKSVDKADDSYSPGASELSATSGVDPNYDFTTDAAIYGMTLGNGSGTSGFPDLSAYYTGGTYNGNLYLQDCTLVSRGGDSIELKAGFYGGILTAVNCTFSNTSSASAWRLVYLPTHGTFRFYGCTFSHTADADTDWTLFSSGSRAPTCVLVEDSDLSGFQYMTYTAPINTTLRRCKIHSSITLASGSLDDREVLTSTILCFDCSSAADINQTNSQFTKAILGYGTCDNQDDTVYRNATDGESSFSIKLTPNATYSSKYYPIEMPAAMSIWHDASGSKTLTVAISSNDSGLLDDEVWIHVSHVSSNATTPATGVFIDTQGTGAAAGTSTYLKTGTIGQWTGSGPSTAYEFQVTGINPAEPGYVYVRLYYGYTGAYSVWVDPAITLT